MTTRNYIIENPPNNEASMMDYFRKVAKERGDNVDAVKACYYRLVRACPSLKKKWQGESSNLDPEREKHKDLHKQKECKILIFDIETAPLKGYFWSLWGQNIKTDFLLGDWFMLTWAAKWLFEDKVYTGKLTPDEVMEEDDGRITKSIWQMFDDADIVVAHNAKKFDVKRLNTRFLLHGLYHPSPYRVIDTLTHARKEFALSSNRLDYIAKKLGLEGKMHTEAGLWQRCSQGDADALDAMEKYNIQDIHVLEDVYIHLRPYMRSHPNVGLYVFDTLEVCPACGDNELKEVGNYATMSNLYTAFRCKCGALSRRRTSKMPVDHKRHLTNSVPR